MRQNHAFDILEDSIIASKTDEGPLGVIGSVLTVGLVLSSIMKSFPDPDTAQFTSEISVH